MKNDYLSLYKKATEYAKKGKAQRKVARTYIQAVKDADTADAAKKKMKKVQTTLENITVNNTFSPNGFWKLCKWSRNLSNNIGTSVINESGKEVFGDDLIREEYKKEFMHRLREREISPDLKNYEQRTKLLCKLYVEESKTKKEPDYSEEELDKVIKKLKKNKSCGRDLIPPEIAMNWGDKLKNLSLSVINSIKSAQRTPNEWANVLISTLYKNKGLRKLLLNQRGIFLKQVLSKIFEKMNMNRIADNVKKIDRTQAGSRTNRSPADQTFL